MEEDKVGEAPAVEPADEKGAEDSRDRAADKGPEQNADNAKTTEDVERVGEKVPEEDVDEKVPEESDASEKVHEDLNHVGEKGPDPELDRAHKGPEGFDKGKGPDDRVGNKGPDGPPGFGPGPGRPSGPPGPGPGRPSGPPGPGKPGGPEEINLDWVLVNELGQFGRFQLRNMLLVSIPIIMSAFMSEYIFSAAAIPHRCVIPECGEVAGAVNEYSPDWILNAIPADSNGNPQSCSRYVSPGGSGTPTSCPANIFNQAVTQECDGFVYDRTNSVVYEWDLGCREWMRALAGTLSSAGTLLVLPITGYVSDKYGRRVALIISVFNLALFGLIRAFSVNYPMYLAFQLLQTTLGAGTFSSSYIFAAELVGPKWRVITSATCSSMFAVGQVILGSVAWAIQPWRYMIMALHIPCFLIITYYWVLSESVRWLLAKQKFPEAKAVLEKVAAVNRKPISEKSMQALMTPPPVVVNQTGSSDGLIKTIVKSRILLRRVLTTPIWWITTTFVYYGLSINSTGLAGNMYLNYILVCAIEIPGFYTAVLVLDRIGRKATLSCGFFLAAACNIIFAFIDNSQLETFSLILFLVGKFGISVVFTSLYLFTSELYPTEFRHTLLAFSSMIGRIGSITAPLTPPLMDYWEGIPSLMFGLMGVIAGLLVLTQPETLGTKMPDTLAEAEAIGQAPKKKADS